MKKYLLLSIILFITTALLAQKVLPKPDPVRFVTDKANVLSEDEKQQLESKLKALSDTSSNQIVIVLIPTLGENDLEEYAHTLFRSWGIGQKKKNNGVLLLAAMNDHKMRIEVGFGLEGAIPDVTAKAITGNDLKPFFKESKYFEGLDSAINDLSRAAVGEYNEPLVIKTGSGNASPMNAGEPSSKGNMLPIFIFFGVFGTIFITIIIVVIRGVRSGRFRSSGSNNYYSSSSSNDDSSSSSWSSSDSSSSDSSSSSDFGGGDSGGGGASDNW